MTPALKVQNTLKVQGALKVLRAGPYMSIQDVGRPGYLRSGVSQGGAMDMRALEEGRLLVGNQQGLAALEMLGLGGRFEAVENVLTCALTGASFTAKIEGMPVEPNTTLTLNPGQILEIGAFQKSNYGYLSIAGGFDTLRVLGSRSTNVRAGFGGFEGRCLKQGDVLSVGRATGGDTRIGAGSYLPRAHVQTGDDIRIIWGAQASMFGNIELQRFCETSFEVTHEIDRMGARLATDAEPIRSEAGLVALSGAIVLGDIQVAGSGRPIILLADRQPTGGYPRIGTIIAADLAKFVQKPAGTIVKFKPVTEDEAIEALLKWRNELDRLPDKLVKCFGDPFDSHKLLSQNLISGVVSSRNIPVSK